jgi:hypothetical protein
MLIKRKLLFINILTVIMLLLFALPAFGQAKDIKGHWAEKQIIAFQGKGLIKGYSNGTFKPENKITRAEFVAIINKAFGFINKAEVNFSDVFSSDWYATDMAIAKAAGYLSGYEDGLVKPRNPISRQEIAAVICKLIKYDFSNSPVIIEAFSDDSFIPLWSRDSIGVVVTEGYMCGYPDKTFRADRNVTRSEVVAVFSKVLGVLYNSAGIYGPAETAQYLYANVTVSKPGVNLRNVIIQDNLFLTEGIGSGRVILDKVVVKGKTIISGGSSGISVKDSIIGLVVIKGPIGNKLKFSVTGLTFVERVEVKSSAKLEEVAATGVIFSDVSIQTGTGSEVDLKGSFKKIEVESNDTKIRLLEANVDDLTIKKAAKKSHLVISSNSVIESLILDSETEITGLGQIRQAEINVSGSSIEKLPDTIEIEPGLELTVDTKKTSAGSSVIRSVNAITYPKTGSIEGTTAEVLVKTSRDGKAYYVVVRNTDQSPAVLQVKAGLNAKGISLPDDRKGYIDLTANEEGTINIEELIMGESYDVYVVCEDTVPNLQLRTAKVSITTLSTISDLYVVESNSNFIEMSFSAPIGATSVNVQRSTNGGVTWTNLNHETLNESSTNVTVSGLKAEVSYKFRLYINYGSYDGYSNIVNITT